MPFRIDTADHFGALANGCVEYVGGARAGQDARLRKGHQFDVHDAAPFFAGAHDGVKMRKSGSGIDVDMTAHRRGAEAGRLRDQGVGPLGGGAHARKQGLLDRQTSAQAGSGTMRLPGFAEEALVEVNVAIDEGRQNQPSAKVDTRHRLIGRNIRFDRHEPAVRHREIRRRAVRQQGVGEEPLDHWAARAVPAAFQAATLLLVSASIPSSAARS
ncbi:MAG: hypothetical protein K0R64_2432 [Novosphingobium lindaniclasticum]|jgi:hypothetical protein|nr:hypothetical protein [Novosphingobium lindaniclasticum]MDF2639448.1 hypothetical protein [Novosphingobium lindaniclasticum]